MHVPTLDPGGGVKFLFARGCSLTAEVASKRLFATLKPEASAEFMCMYMCVCVRTCMRAAHARARKSKTSATGSKQI